MIQLARVYVRSVLRGGFTWIVLAVAGLLGIVGVSLDLFGFDGDTDRSMGVVFGTFEIATAIVAIWARAAGIASNDSSGFRAAVLQTAGPIATELGPTIGAGIGAASASYAGVLLIYVFYNLHPFHLDTLLRLALLGPSLGVLGVLSAAWGGLGARLAGRIGAIVLGIAAFVVARLDVPAAARACLPGPVPATIAGMLGTLAVGALAALGLVLVTGAAPTVGEETS